MISDKIKYIADLLMGLAMTSASLDKNYKQLPIGLAIFICVVGFSVIALFAVVGITILINTIK